MNIYVINKSSVIDDAEVESWIPAFKQYVRLVNHWWPRATDVKYVTEEHEPTTAWKLIIADTSDDAGALGYHDFTPDGRPISYVFAKDDEKYGYSPTVTATHELAEMIADPWISQVFQISDTQFFAQEIADPCEADEFAFSILGIQVSDFVTPRWFIPDSTKNYVFDYCRLIIKPMTILAGGYMSMYESGRGWTQIGANEKGEIKYAPLKNKGKYSRANKYHRNYHNKFDILGSV
jgi:hypothetical protein